MRYLTLLALFLKNNLLTELEYRANFMVQVGLGFFWSWITVLSAVIIFARTDSVGGWRFDEMLLIVGLYELIGGIVATFLQPNVRRIVSMIRDGTMDFVLSKPVNSQFLASLRHSRLSGLAQVLSGPVILVVALNRLNYTPTWQTLLAFVLMVGAAIVLVYSIWIMIATIAFVAVKVDELGELFNSLFETGKFPITTFQDGIRLILTFLLPIAFMTTFPAQALLNKLSAVNLLLGIALATFMFGLSTWVWRKAVLNYSSASS